MADVLVIAEVFEKQLRRTTLSAVSFAKDAAAKLGGAFDVLVLGEGAEAAAGEAAKFGARKVLYAEVPGGYLCERYAPTAAKVANDGGYGVVTATATPYGKDLMGRVAAKLEAGLAPDIASFEVVGDRIRAARAMYAGNVFGTMEVTTKVQVVTVRQTEFEAAEPEGSASSIETVELVEDALSSRVDFVSLEVVKSERPDLTEADVVVSGGRALKSAENFEKVLEPLVDLLGAAMGASRAACDAGYVANELQVGQTGKVVAPKLYIAVGISGAIQHIAGMKGSKVIVAINKDKEAPIAQIADYFLAEDLFKAVPALTEQIKGLR